MDSFSKYLTVAANIGILGGLVLVFGQMRQNEELLKITLLNQYNEAYIAADHAVGGETLSEVWAKSFEDPGNLTLAEMRALEAQTFSPLLRWANLYRMHRAGLIEDSVWRSEITNDAGFYFTSPYARTWWETFSVTLNPSVLPPEVKEQINEALNTQRANPAETYNAIRDSIRKSLTNNPQQ